MMSMRALIHTFFVALLTVLVAISASGCGSSSASAQVAVVVEQINGLGASDIVPLNSDQVIFWGRTGTVTTGTGAEPWVSDGTVAGTVQVKDIRAGDLGSSPSSIAGVPMTVINERAYFVANDGTIGWSLWSSDGTESGTVIETTLLPPDVDLQLDEGTTSNGNQIFVSGFDSNTFQIYFFAITIG